MATTTPKKPTLQVGTDDGWVTVGARSPSSYNLGPALFAAQVEGPAEPEPTGFFRGVGDTGIALGRGLATGVKSLTDVAGADNPVSGALGATADYLSSLESPGRAAERAARQQTIQQADASGAVLPQITSRLGALAEAPIDTLVEAAGSTAPTLAGAFIPGVGPAAIAARIAAPIVIGAAQGAGAAKGSIYERVLAELTAAGMPPEVAKQNAIAAQDTLGENAANIAAAAALGGAAGRFGVEGAVERAIAGRAAASAGRRAAAGGAGEAITEAAQSGQEQYAGNVALGRQGIATDPYQGVAGEAVFGGTVGGLLGGGIGAAAPGHFVPPTAPPAGPPGAPPASGGINPPAGPAQPAGGPPIEPGAPPAGWRPGTEAWAQPSGTSPAAFAAGTVDPDLAISRMHDAAAAEAQSLRNLRVPEVGALSRAANIALAGGAASDAALAQSTQAIAQSEPAKAAAQPAQPAAPADDPRLVQLAHLEDQIRKIEQRTNAALVDPTGLVGEALADLGNQRNALRSELGLAAPVEEQAASAPAKAASTAPNAAPTPSTAVQPATDAAPAPSNAAQPAPPTERDAYYDQAVKVVQETGKGSISLLQRSFRIGYNRAARLLEQMEAAGIVSPMNPDGSRTVPAAPASRRSDTAAEVDPDTGEDTPTRLRKFTEAITARWANAPAVEVLGSMDEAPAEVRAEYETARRGGAQGRPEGFFHQGKVYLVADAIPTDRDAARVLFHEALGHAGLAGTFGEKLTGVLDQIVAARRDDVRSMAERRGLPATREGLRHAAEEVLAEMAQSRPELGFVKRAIAAIRGFLRSMGLTDSVLSDAEIVREYLEPARRFVEQGAGAEREQRAAPAAAPEPAPAFSETRFALSKKPGSDVGHRRETATGRYVGAPDWIGNSPGKLATLRKQLRNLAREGEPGRMWYERSSQAILDVVGGDRAEAERLVSLIAIYSPNATVPANTSMALTAYYQWKAGRPIDAGFSAADAKAEKLLRKNEPWSGIKTNSFYQNLMVEIDPSKLDPGVATMDMWMALAFDYGSKALDQGPKYKFAEREIGRLGEELGWKPHQVQAAVWTAIKARVESTGKERKALELQQGIGEMIDDPQAPGKQLYRVVKGREYDHFRLATKLGLEYALDPADVERSKYDFANALGDRTAQMSWEATPSTTAPQGIPGIFAAPTEQKSEYLQAVMDVLTVDGRDAIADMVGLPQGVNVLGISAWQGDTGAGVQTLVPVPSQGAGKGRAVKEAAREVLNLYAAAKGYVLSQDAVVWHTPVWDDAQVRHNGADIRTGRPLSEAEVRQLYDGLHAKFGTWELAPGYTPNGARVLNFVDGLDNKAFQKGVREVLATMPDGWGGGEAGVAGFRSDGDYIGNDWKESPNGEGYRDQIAARRPDLQGGLERLRARVAAVNSDFARRYGWGEARGRAGAATEERAGEEVAPPAGGAARFSLAPPTDSDAFKRWFGDSKVVDEKGAPKVVYHGRRLSPYPDAPSLPEGITTFEPGGGRRGIGKAERSQGTVHADGMWFGSRGEAEQYAGVLDRSEPAPDESSIYPVYLSIQNPARMGWAEARGASVDDLKAKGHDGVYIVDNGNWVAFEPEQIKSATGNRGTYDASNPDIRFALSPGAAAVRAREAVTDLFDSQTGFNWWHRTVGTQIEKARANPYFARVYHATQTFLGDISKYANRAADEAPTLLPKLEHLRDALKAVPKADREAIARPIFEGTLADTDPANGRVWMDGELRSQFGLDDRQVSLYREFRSAVDRSLDDLAKAEMLRDAGRTGDAMRGAVMDATSAAEAADMLATHLQSVADADPEQAETIAATIERVRAKADRIEALKAGGYAPLMRFGRHAVSIRRDDQQLFFALYESPAAAARAARAMRDDPEFAGATFERKVMPTKAWEQFKGINPETLEVFGSIMGVDNDAVFQQYLALAKNQRSAMKRLIHRKGTAGFSEDVTRTLAAFVVSNARATSSALNLREIANAVEDTRRAAPGDVADEAVKLAQYVQSPTDSGAKVRGLLFIQYLGGSVASALVNMTQNLTMGLPYLAQFEGNRGLGLKGAGKAAAALTRSMTEVARRATFDREPELAAALRRAAQEGVVAPQEIHHLYNEAGADVFGADAWRKFTFLWGSMFSLAEQFNRRSMFVAAYRMAEERGAPDAYAAAVQAVEDTQGIYNSGNRPNWARGPVGGFVMTFKQFMVAYLEFLKRLPARQKGLALAVLMLTAGAEGLPGADDLDDIIDTVAAAMGYNFSSKRAKREWLGRVLGADGAEIVLKGASSVPGVPLDVAGRMSMGNLVPASGMFLPGADKSRAVLELAGAGGGFIDSLTKGAQAGLAGDVGQAASEIVPVAMKNALKAWDMAQTGMYRDAAGRRVTDVDAVDVAMKAVGFQPQEVAREQRGAALKQTGIDAAREAETRIAARWARGVFEGDQDVVQRAKQEVARWNEKNPETPIRINSAQIQRRVKEMRATRSERQAARAPRELRQFATEGR